ncbi:MFS transporter [Actinomadura sp. NTSP31]|uniref:MFS transporter n=1 Tax=Actinomadura sp. NTSP31 TaxID=1735447 RepID=UPI0035BFA1F5
MTTALPAAEPAAGPRPRRLPRAAAFWTLTATLLAFMAAAAAPSPLYVVYQAEWKFSATTLTVVFAVYALALLAALVTVGALSDHIGRRPVLAAALIAQVAAMLLFVAADGVGWLVAARILQGLATGTATGAISAGLVDLQPPHDQRLASLVNSATPGIGLGAGALGSGLLVQYAPAPTTLVYWLLAALCALAVAGILAMPETSARRPGALASLRPQVSVPRGARGTFLLVVPSLVATWGVVGLYMSLGPSLAAGVLGVHNHLVGGLVVFALMAASAAAVIATGPRPPRPMMIGGSLVLAVGLALTLTALAAESTPLFFTATVISGLGFGAAFLGAFRIAAGLAEPARRAALFATVYTLSYLAFSLPAVAAGIATTHIGLRETADVYGGAVIALALLAAGGLLLKRPTAGNPPQS